MAGLKNHTEHLAPQVLCFERFMQLQLTRACHFFVLLVALFKGFAIQVVQIRHVVG